MATIFLEKTMLMIDSIWFEIAIVSIIYAIGNIVFGHFEEHTSKIKRVSKYILTLIIIAGISTYFGRTIALVTLALFFLPAIYIHTIALPKKGINGWTAEPKEKYYELRGWDKDKLYRKKE